jgi:hypothetical protein
MLYTIKQGIAAYIAVIREDGAEWCAIYLSDEKGFQVFNGHDLRDDVSHELPDSVLEFLRERFAGIFVHPIETRGAIVDTFKANPTTVKG